MNALGDGGRLVRMAGGTLNFLNFWRMRKVLNARVAVRAAEDSMCAGGMLLRANGNVFSFFGLHPRLAMTGKTCFVLLQRLNLLGLPAGTRGGDKGNDNAKYS